VALQSFWTFAASHIGSFLNYFRHMVGLLGRVISPSQGLYLHRTTQHRKTRTNIHALSGIRTHDPSNLPAKTHASDRTATVTGNKDIKIKKLLKLTGQNVFARILLCCNSLSVYEHYNGYKRYNCRILSRVMGSELSKRLLCKGG
jgi:hypothetical protein